MLENFRVPNNSEMGACKRICSNMHGQNFFNEVAYLSGQVTKIFQNAKIENKNKCRLLEARKGQG